jgi:site-specific DNA-methyltransferase (adenine-specific)
MKNWHLQHGDALAVLRKMPSDSMDSIVTDPPYGLAFMGKKWDYDVPDEAIWRECLRVLKPGGYLLAFAGTRTQHRMAVRIEDAGFEIRDLIAWVYGSGFPKSLDVSKAIDKAAGADPATDAARQWHGWGTALKPAMEPVTVARKPLVGTVAANVLTHGTGALNIDGTRIQTSAVDFAKLFAGVDAIRKRGGVMGNSWANRSDLSGANPANPLGRWPANLIHDGSDEVMELFPQAGGGSVARFFYCAKANQKERDAGCDAVKQKPRDETRREGDPGGDNPRNRGANPRSNHHPTVKPVALMRYLCRLVTPIGGVVLDPFAGSGSTGIAALAEGMQFIGIEREAEYVQIAKSRLAEAARGA